MPPPTPMRALIIDDEPHARRYLRELLGGNRMSLSRAKPRVAWKPST